MSLIGRIAKRLRAAGARGRLERDMQEEMQAHIEQAVERFRARGMSDADARVAARREFGNVGVLQEQARDARGARWIESLAGDIRHAGRQFVRAPILAAVIILTLTLGIGVSGAAFSVLSGIFTRPAPGMPADPALVAVRGIHQRDGMASARWVTYQELMAYATIPQFREVAGWTQSAQVVTQVGGQDVGTAYATFVTPNFFRVIGLRVSPGNDFVQRAVGEHADPEMHAILGNLHAIQRFGSAEAAVGKTIQVNGVPVEVIGVAPPRFLSPLGEGSKQVMWLPVSAWPVIDKVGGNVFNDPKKQPFSTVARLRPGVTVAEATPAVELAAKQLAATSAPRSSRSVFTADVVPLIGNARFKSDRSEDIQAVAMISIAVVLILLVCTTTVSSLLVGVAVTRRQEIAVRLALGASRRRIVRQLLTENALLALVAGAAGLGLFALIARGLRNSVTDANIDPTWTTAVATAGFALVAAVLCGLSPALHATRDALSGVLKDSSTTATVRSRLQRVFVVSQIALTQPLLVGLAMAIAIVMRETSGSRSTATLGDYVVRAEFDAWSAAARAENKMPALIARLSALPGVVAVLPQSGNYAVMKFEAPAVGSAAPSRFDIRTHAVPPGYFKTLDIPVIRGREFTNNDLVPDSWPIVIGTDFAKLAFGGVDPVGKKLGRLGFDGSRRGEVLVVGVVAAEDVGNSESGAQMRVFTPLSGAFSAQGIGPDILLIRTQRLASGLIPTFQEIARAEAPMMPVSSMKTLAQVEQDKRSELVQAAGSAAVGGIITLFLAAIGLYAVVALSVTQRSREIGVRVSLGASPRQVVAHFFKSGLRVSLTGLLIGLPLSAAALRLLGAQVGIPRTNMPVIAAAVALTVVIVASLASWLPARRAAGVDPLVALRSG